MNVDGTNLVQLTDSPAKEDHGAWSPDGRFIAYQHDAGDNTDVYVMAAEGSDKTRLTTHTARDGWPDWSPESRNIASSSERDGHREIYVMNRDGTRYGPPGGDRGRHRRPDRSWVRVILPL